MLLREQSPARAASHITTGHHFAHYSHRRTSGRTHAWPLGWRSLPQCQRHRLHQGWRRAGL